MRGSSRSRNASIILLLLSTCALGLAATTGTTVQRQRSVLNKRKPLPALAGKAIKTRHAGRGRLSHRGGAAPAKPTDRRISLAFPIFAAFLYNLSIGFTIPVLPKIINTLVNGDPKVTPKSSRFYGWTSATDQLMTFLLVNAACSLSDRYGRRPFMALANTGLGAGQVIAALAGRAEWLLLGAFVDGCTSFSYPLAQAYIADITPPAKLSEAYGLFQGLATGGAFLLGIPISGIIAQKTGNLRLPLYISASICALNILYITLVLPESLPPSRRKQTTAIQEANAWGAFKTVGRNPFIALLAACYFLLHLALNGLQINFVNFTQYKFGWGVAQSSGALCFVFLFTAIFPKLLLPLLGIKRAVSYCSLVYAAGFAALGLASQTWVVLLSLVLIAAGTTCLPATLALLTNQFPASEKGVANGAADTVRTLSTTLGFPLMTSVFGYFISDKAPFKLPGASLLMAAGLTLLANLSLQIAIAFHNHHDQHVEEAKK